MVPPILDQLVSNKPGDPASFGDLGAGILGGMPHRFPALFARGLARGVFALGAILWLGGAIVAGSLGQEADRDLAPAVRYGRDIRPILSDRCFLCHGPDEAKREAHLRLDVREEAIRLRKGVAAIVPGDPEASEMWYRVGSEDPNEVMPPPESHRATLTAEQRELVGLWIEQGAPYEDHWAFTPPVRPAPPSSDAQPIDAFLLDALAQHGLEYAGPVAPSLALRRLFLDLTGLPPTPEEIDGYLAVRAELGEDEAWSQQVQRLFHEEPYRTRYAERMTSPWLDQARYADTSGIHTDAGRQIWPWRDWVLEAYRTNMPFDQFLVQQLAGDLLPQGDNGPRVATGFLRNHVTTDEGGAIDAEYLVEYAVDRVDTTSRVFLGLTVSCARCHDHKFDPIRQEDYYRLFAFFGQNDEPGLYSQEPNPKRALEPFLEVPSPAQEDERRALQARVTEQEAQLAQPSAADQAALEAFEAGLGAELELVWQPSHLTSATSDQGATLTITPADTVLASGANPEVDIHRLQVQTEATGLRLVQLDVLGDASFTNGAPGRAGNGNAVLTGLHARARSIADPSQVQELDWAWIWTDYAQSNEDFSLNRALRPPFQGWAINAHNDPSDRVAWLVSDQPFGFEGGTQLEVELEYQSPYAGHVFGHVRVGLAQFGDQGLERLPVAQGRWYHAGPFPLASAEGAYAAHFGPEQVPELDLEASFEANGPVRWTYRADFADGVVNALPDGTNVHYLGRELYSPTARLLEVSIGSDDGFAIYVNGAQVAAREVARGCLPDQDRVTLPLRAGRNALVFQVINTGGAAGFFYKSLPQAQLLTENLVCAAVDTHARKDQGQGLQARIAHAWRLSHSEEYRAGTAALAALRGEQAALEAAIPRTMVMRDRPMARELFVLERGQYDHPDRERPVSPGIPIAFGDLPAHPEGEPATRLDLARWMVAPDNPLVARVAVNRLWQMIFGRGIVATSGDFGYQGSWPTHPELLDWLAVEFVESGWDVQHMLALMVESRAYRQGSAPSERAQAIDPTNLWLSHFPRQRLDAERIRDTALYVAGILQEDFGGPSVKPYQPEGLWREVAMTASNTRFFERGMGNELWRRSVYTYWKRACPPPAMLTFDAPTREACVVQRATTNTPLQALVLWNDEQFREAARALAQRALAEGDSTPAKLATMFQRCTGRLPSTDEAALLESALDQALVRFASDTESAEAWVRGGMLPRPMGMETQSLAAWTFVASSLLNLHATLTNG